MFLNLLSVNVNSELPDVQAGFRKGTGTRDQIANIHWIMEKAREFQKNIYFRFIDQAKAIDSVDYNKLENYSTGKFLKRGKYHATLPTSWEICMNVKNQQLEPDMEQNTGPKLGREYIKTIYCQPAYLTYIQSTSREMPGWMKHKLESRLLGEISITDMQMTPPLWQKEKKD